MLFKLLVMCKCLAFNTCNLHEQILLQVKQPMFGANSVKGDVISEPDGNDSVILNLIMAFFSVINTSTVKVACKAVRKSDLSSGKETMLI